jgi:secreted trypsin-like serine protease
MRIRLMLALGVLVALFAAAIPAQAIVGGTSDNGAHPYVAAVSNGSTICSAAAISPTVLVTAAHCFAFPTEAVRVIFDDNFRNPARVLHPGTWYAHPAFCATCNPEKKQALTDIAVVVLDAPVSLPRYARLAPLGLTDRLGARTSVEIVGYGVSEFDRKTPLPATGERMRANADLLRTSKQVGDELLEVSARLSQDRGASCFGDSGGPVLLGDTILGVTSFGTNDRCRVATYAYRVDAPVAQSFVSAPR